MRNKDILSLGNHNKECNVSKDGRTLSHSPRRAVGHKGWGYAYSALPLPGTPNSIVFIPLRYADEGGGYVMLGVGDPEKHDENNKDHVFHYDPDCYGFYNATG